MFRGENAKIRLLYEKPFPDLHSQPDRQPSLELFSAKFEIPATIAPSEGRSVIEKLLVSCAVI